MGYDLGPIIVLLIGRIVKGVVLCLFCILYTGVILFYQKEYKMEVLDDEWIQKLLNDDVGVSDSIVSNESLVNIVNDANSFSQDETTVKGGVVDSGGAVVDSGGAVVDSGGPEDDDEETTDDIDKWIERNHPEYVNLYFVYISTDFIIKKIITEKIELEDGGLLKKELLFYMIQNKKRNNFKLGDILLYQNDISDIGLTFDSKLESGEFLKILPIIDNINFNEQMRLFQSFNSVYIFLNEIDKSEVEIVNGRKTFKRVPYKKYTRKVRCFTGDEQPQLKNNMKKTRKRVSFDV